MHNISKEDSNRISLLEKQLADLQIKEAKIKDFKAEEISANDNLQYSKQVSIMVYPRSNINIMTC